MNCHGSKDTVTTSSEEGPIVLAGNPADLAEAVMVRRSENAQQVALSKVTNDGAA